MVVRSSRRPRLPRMYWGEIIYATPGSGKTVVANKYRDVIDADDLIVEAISEYDPNFDFEGYHGSYDDPRVVIFEYFKYIKFNRRKMWGVYNIALQKMRDHCDNNNVVLLGTKDLMQEADRLFLQNNDSIIRSGFNADKEQKKVNDLNLHITTHRIDNYLDNCLHKACQGFY
mmetsp:Transcript_7218/g.9138  ORF Transcript_7218/g.9138 Transcript_7218/m.9138 type:complete len:172 (-) Transcript_7218:1550-2065(-)